MGRKRKRTRRVNPAPLLISAVLLAAVAWTLVPHGHRARVQAPAVPIQSPSAQSTPPQSIAATAVPSPQATSAPSPTASAKPGGVRVAIIIDDCGQWISTEREYLQLPIPLTLAVLPHVHYTAEIAQEAAGAGKGVMLHLPMEPISHLYPGPGEITTAMTDDEVSKQTQDDVAQVPLAKGFNNHEGSAASADERVMKDVIAVAKNRGLFFIDSRTNVQTVGALEAQAAGVPSASRDVFLDNKESVAYTELMLQRTVAIAERNGEAIAIGHPKPTTLEALREMYPKMEASGVQFVLASSLVR